MLRLPFSVHKYIHNDGKCQAILCKMFCIFSICLACARTHAYILGLLASVLEEDRRAINPRKKTRERNEFYWRNFYRFIKDKMCVISTVFGTQNTHRVFGNFFLLKM